MLSRRLTGSLLVLLSWCPTTLLFGQAVKLAFGTVEQSVIQQRLESVPRKVADRKSQLTSLFREAGCEVTEQPVPHVKQPNLICTLPGDPGKEIVVGGHYDSIEAGMGVIDDWSGAALLPSLYQALKTAPRRHPFAFVAFSGEEQGLLGSQAFVHQLGKEAPARIWAMVNLECLGVGPPVVWARRADQTLLGYYSLVAQSIHIEARGVNVDSVGDDDSHPFLDAQIPVLTMHSVNQDTLRLLHTRWDNLAAIHPADYYDAYRMAVAYLAFLDERAN